MSTIPGLTKGRVVLVTLPEPMFGKIGGESEHTALVTLVRPTEGNETELSSRINAAVFPPVGPSQSHGDIAFADELPDNWSGPTWRWPPRA